MTRSAHPPAMPPMTLVLGASGRIGQALRRFAPAAVARGGQMRWQARRPQTAETERGAGTGAGAAEDWRIFAPLGDQAALQEAAAGCERILCLAGSVPGRGGALADNTALALAAVRAGAEVGASVLLASSAAVYGAQAGPLHEDLPLAPAHPYGAAKAEMETAAQTLGQQLGVGVCALRIGNVAGFDAILGGWKPGFQLDQFAEGRTPDTTPRRSYVGVATLAHIIYDLLACETLPAALNIAQAGPVAMGDLLRAADLEFATRPAGPDAIPEVAFDLTRLQGVLGRRLPVADPGELVQEWRDLTEGAPHA